MLWSSQLVGLSLFKKVWKLDYHFYSVAAENLNASWVLKSILQTTPASGHFYNSIQSLTQLFLLHKHAIGNGPRGISHHSPLLCKHLITLFFSTQAYVCFTCMMVGRATRTLGAQILWMHKFREQLYHVTAVSLVLELYRGTSVLPQLRLPFFVYRSYEIQKNYVSFKWQH